MMLRTYNYLYSFFINYPTPANLTNVWNFGILSFAFLLLQIVSGLGLSMYYVPTEEFAFVFVEYIMRDTFFGWLFRYIHSNGASLFFFFVYLHFFRGLYYFSYVHPKTAIWNTGVLILVLMIITAFTGYVLPWGQMSFRACTVITNLASALPFFGPDTVTTIWGSYGVSTVTLNRFYTIHFFLPFVILFVMVVHFYYLHDVGSSNGTRVFSIRDKMKFHPYYTWKDVVAVVAVISAYLFIILNTPNYLSHEDNYIPADALVTPPHIVPEWYFLPFYAILRAVPNKLGGVFLLLWSISILFLFPSQVRLFYNSKMWHKYKCDAMTMESARFFAIVTKRTNPLAMKYLYWMFVVAFIGLSYIGMQPVEKPYLFFGGLFTWMYFAFFYANVYIHSFNFWVIYMKGYFIPELLFLGQMNIKGIKWLYNRWIRHIAKYNPLFYRNYLIVLKLLNEFFFKYIMTRKLYEKIKNVKNKIVSKIKRWEELEESGDEEGELG